MIDASFEVDFSFRDESETFVKPYRRCLRREQGFFEPAFSGFFNKSFHDRPPNAFIAVGFQYGYAADMAVWEQASSAHWFIFVKRERMNAVRIATVDLEFGRHALFIYEDFESDGQYGFGLRFVVGNFDSGHR